MTDRLVDQVDAADHVVRVVEPPDEVREPLPSVRGQVIDVAELVLVEEACEGRVVGDAGSTNSVPSAMLCR